MPKYDSLKQLESCSRLVIYGAGMVATRIVQFMSETEYIKKAIIVVTNLENNPAEICGVKVVLSSSISPRYGDFVIIAVGRKTENEVALRVKEIGYYNYYFYYELYESFVRYFDKLPIKKNKIFFDNFYGESFGRNPKYIALELLRNHKDYELVWSLENLNDKEDFPNGIRCVRKESYDYYYEMSTSKVWICNNTLTSDLKKKKEQIYIQTWHGCGPLKKVGLDENRKSYDFWEKHSAIIDLMISPCSFNTDQYKRAFLFRGQILESGYPRNDIFYKPNDSLSKVHEYFSISRNEKIVLYAPSFRTYGAANQIDYRRLIDALERKYKSKFCVLVRYHSADKFSHFDTENIDCCYDATGYPDVQELLSAADVLVTDYSSIMWDFSLQMKPVFLFHPDIKEYNNDRGMYISFDEMPYIESFDDNDLEGKIMSFDNDKYKREVVSFLDKWGSFDDGHASERVVDWVVRHTGGKKSEK